jgi:hypothetical protein
MGEHLQVVVFEGSVKGATEGLQKWTKTNKHDIKFVTQSECVRIVNKTGLIHLTVAVWYSV